MVYFLTRRLISTQQNVEDITTSVVSINGNISSINATIGNAQSSISAITNNVSSITNNVSLINSNISSLSATLGNTQNNISTIQSNISVLQANIAAMPSPASFSNTIVYFGTATITTPNKLYFLNDAGSWALASNSNSKGKLLAIAVGTNSSTSGMYIASNPNNLQISVADAAIGGAVYVSSSAGELTGQQPPGQDLSLVRQVGYKISANEVKFYLYPIYITPMGSNGYGIATQIGGTSSTITDTHQFTLFSYTALLGTRTFTISVAGLFDILMVGGAGGGGSGVGYNGEGGGGGSAECLKNWLPQNNTCPNCRGEWLACPSSPTSSAGEAAIVPFSTPKQPRLYFSLKSPEPQGGKGSFWLPGQAKNDQRLTYQSLSQFLGIDYNPNGHMGTSIETAFPFFVKFQIELEVYDIQHRLIFKLPTDELKEQHPEYYYKIPTADLPKCRVMVAHRHLLLLEDIRLDFAKKMSVIKKKSDFQTLNRQFQNFFL